MTERTAFVAFSGAANGWELGLHRAVVPLIPFLIARALIAWESGSFAMPEVA